VTFGGDLFKRRSRVQPKTTFLVRLRRQVAITNGTGQRFGNVGYIYIINPVTNATYFFEVVERAVILALQQVQLVDGEVFGLPVVRRYCAGPHVCAGRTFRDVCAGPVGRASTESGGQSPKRR